MSTAARVGLAAALLVLLSPAAAVAAPPPNDSRSTPERLAIPSTVTGTTAESTVEPDEPFGCAPLSGSVFYEFRAPGSGRLVLRLDAAGDLDATLEVFQRTRSLLTQLGCEITDQRGQAAIDFRPRQGATYVVRVGQRAGSAPGSFRLDAFQPEPPPGGPGMPLRPRGANGNLDSLQDTQDAWSYRMRAGTTYRINLTARTCMTLQVYAPGTRDFESTSPERTAGCDGYLLFTPEAGEGGRYSFLVTARPRRRGEQPYHLQAAPAGVDDTAPGLRLPNLRRVRGGLRGNAVDTVDLYRFSIGRRSDLQLTLDSAADMSLVLLDDRGRRRGGGQEISRRIAPGRYFVAVRTRSGAVGRYTLRRVSRTITRTTTTIDGERSATASPGQTVSVGVDVAPGAAGPVRITIERFDPLAGWLFHREVRTRAAAGHAGIAFTPPAEGRWRARAEFRGTRIAAPSASGHANLLVAAPLPTSGAD